MAITIGKPSPNQYHNYILCSEKTEFWKEYVQSISGRIFRVERVGFPGVVIVRSKTELNRSFLMRIMKSLSLGISRAVEEEKINWSGKVVINAEIEKEDKTCLKEPSFSVRHSMKSVEFIIKLTVDWLNSIAGDVENLRFYFYKKAGEAIRTKKNARGSSKKIKCSGSRNRVRNIRPKVLFFTNPFVKDVDKGDAFQINPGIHYLISSLSRKDVDLILLDNKFPLQDVTQKPPDFSRPLSPEEFITEPDKLEKVLESNPDLTLICLTVLERCFGQVYHLCEFLRKRSNALIAVGGVFPTLAPEHAFVHLHHVNFVVRGDGEEILPAIVGVASNVQKTGEFSEEDIEILSGFNGVISHAGNTVVSCGFDEINRIEDIDKSNLDFSFFEKKNVQNGISISTSRGCIYNCRFCSVMDKRVWRGKSASKVLEHFRNYNRRLEEIFGSCNSIPESARKVQIWDDDFFIDSRRAISILEGIKSLGFTITFIQGTVNSFFRRNGLKILDELNDELINSIPVEVFSREGGLKIGTENFCDEELKRIGKPYRYEKIRKLVLALYKRGIFQEHFMILCNRETTLENLMDNFEKIAELRWIAGEGFRVLEPSWLMNLFVTSLYRICQVKDRESAQPTGGCASIPGYLEFDYPFVLPEKPGRNEVFEVVRRFPKGMHFGCAGQPCDRFDGVWGPDDSDYLKIFHYVEKVLIKRLEEISSKTDFESIAEKIRIEEVLSNHFIPSKVVPSGLMRRIATGLNLPPIVSDEQIRFLSEYISSLFEGCLNNMKTSVEKARETDGYGVILKVEEYGTQVKFLVKRKIAGNPSAFSTKNLDFIFLSSNCSREDERRVARIIEKVKLVAESKDSIPLQ